jgi:hypothetical protein
VNLFVKGVLVALVAFVAAAALSAYFRPDVLIALANRILID